eukprot:scaffold20586_cov17-Tisochrysis_lutea.AAC.1
MGYVALQLAAVNMRILESMCLCKLAAVLSCATLPFVALQLSHPGAPWHAEPSGLTTPRGQTSVCSRLLDEPEDFPKWLFMAKGTWACVGKSSLRSFN